jgi:hypothetical protein
MRWFGRWLRRCRLREWWSDSANGGKRKKFAEERERLEGEERERVVVVAWWPVGEEFKQPLVVETVMKQRW